MNVKQIRDYVLNGIKYYSSIGDKKSASILQNIIVYIDSSKKQKEVEGKEESNYQNSNNDKLNNFSKDAENSFRCIIPTKYTLEKGVYDEIYSHESIPVVSVLSDSVVEIGSAKCGITGNMIFAEGKMMCDKDKKYEIRVVELENGHAGLALSEVIDCNSVSNVEIIRKDK